MSHRHVVCANPATAPSATIRHPEHPTLLRAAATFALVACIAWGTPAMARGGGGFMHGMGGLGMHGGQGMGQGMGHGLGPGRRAFPLTPAYVLITVAAITDADAFKAAMSDVTTATAPFGGHLAADMDKPAAWDGTAPAHVVMLQFDNPDQAQAWKASDAFKTFDAALQRSAQASMTLVQGLPTPVANADQAGRGGRRSAGFDPKAFEPNVKEYDEMLSKMHGICKGC